MNDHDIYHRAAPEKRAASLGRVVDDAHHLPDERMLLEQVAELEDGRPVGHGVCESDPTLQSGTSIRFHRAHPSLSDRAAHTIFV